MKVTTSLIIILISICLLICGCSYDNVTTFDDNIDVDYLPYRFTSIAKSKNSVYPIDLGEGYPASTYELQNNWRKPDSLSAIVFKKHGMEGPNTIDQQNFNTVKFDDHLAYDMDNDDTSEVVLTYHTNDSMVLEIFNPYKGPIYRKVIDVGVDNNGNGYWDGELYLQTIIDINNDDFPEILLSISTGYDLTPRRVICLDWYNDTTLWKTDVAGYIGQQHIQVALDEQNEPRFVFGSGSPCNGNTCFGMDDCHSYLLCLDKKGNVQWYRKTGPKHSSVHPQMIRFPGEQNDHIICQEYTDISNGAYRSKILVLTLQGQAIDSLLFESTIRRPMVYAYPDSEMEIFVATEDFKLWIYDTGLRHVKTVQFNSDIYVYDIADIVGDDSKEILICDASNTYLLSTDFTLLAKTSIGGIPKLTTKEIAGFSLIINSGNQHHKLNFEKNSLLKIIIYQYRNHLIILLTFLSAGLLTSLFFQNRLKSTNLLIRKQQSELSETLKELKATQQKLIEVEKDKMTKTIAGSFAHEIRNALFPALTMLSSIRKQIDSGGDEISQQFSMTDKAINRAINLTNHILQFTKLKKQGPNKKLILHDNIKQVLNDHANRLEAEQISVKLSCHDPVSIRGDEILLNIVWSNLITNSIDSFNNRSGDKWIEITILKENVKARIKIVDNGCGIGTDNLEKIFESFYTTKPDTGVGLGLAFTKKILDLHNGTISVSSIPESGTTITIMLPFDEV